MAQNNAIYKHYFLLGSSILAIILRGMLAIIETLQVFWSFYLHNIIGGNLNIIHIYILHISNAVYIHIYTQYTVHSTHTYPYVYMHVPMHARMHT